MLGSPDDALRRQPRVAMLSSVGYGGEYYMSSLLPTPRPSLEAQLKDKPPGYQTLHLPIELYALRSLVVAGCTSHSTLRELVLRYPIYLQEKPYPMI